MEITNIATLRKYINRPGWELVFEWEDVFAQNLLLDYKYETKIKKMLNGVAKYIKINPAKYLPPPRWTFFHFRHECKDF